jgi:hypothetical protein
MNIIPSGWHLHPANQAARPEFLIIYGAPILAFHKHCVTLPNHFVPGRPREAEAESSEDRDWRSEASPIPRKSPKLARRGITRAS